ncbi:MAG TPA: hypothetical protein VL915_06095 [Gemmatimonadales bacterium]|nr:hypothetical protein [Gemmatimonadales bacterium]
MRPAADADSDCAARLRLTLAAALEYVATATERGESPAPSPPPALAEEIRLAARHGVDLVTMFRCCNALHAALVDFLLAEIVDGQLAGERLGPLLHALYLPGDRLLAEVSLACSAEGAYA